MADSFTAAFAMAHRIAIQDGILSGEGCLTQLTVISLLSLLLQLFGVMLFWQVLYRRVYLITASLR